MEIGDFPKNHPPKIPGKMALPHKPRSDFVDSSHWDQLARKHLSAFSLPKWSVLCTPERMARWAERLNITEAEYRRQTMTSFEQFIRLNPDWPLRAWIGLLLESAES